MVIKSSHATFPLRCCLIRKGMKFIDPWLWDKVNSGIGLSYRPASHEAWRTGTTTLCRSWLYLPSQVSINSGTDLLETVQHSLVALRLRTEHRRAGDARRGGDWTERTGGARAGRRYHRRLGRFQVFILVVLGHLQHKKPLLQIHEILIRIRIRGSITFDGTFTSFFNNKKS